MISEEEARTQIDAAVDVLGEEQVPLAEALGRFLREEIRARVAIPAFDNSAMDGYAVVAAGVGNGSRLRLIGEQAAGPACPLAIEKGEAVRIFTGAPLPAGADAVVMQEEAERQGDEVVIHAKSVSVGEFVRRAGGDLAAGQLLAKMGERITPALIGLFATQGLTEVRVGRRARVAVLSTGDELRPPGATLRPGEIYDSNAPMLAALLQNSDAEVAERLHVPDDKELLRAVLERALGCDAVVISGGVSVGERDFVQAILGELGVKIELWRVAVKPGKPFLFGRKEKCAIFGLPGNPVSSFVTFHLFVRPALSKMMGANAEAMTGTVQSIRMATEIANEDQRAHYLRGKIREGVFSTVGRQESHALFGLAQADALLRLGPGERVAAGELRSVLRLS